MNNTEDIDTIDHKLNDTMIIYLVNIRESCVVGAFFYFSNFANYLMSIVSKEKFILQL